MIILCYHKPFLETFKLLIENTHGYALLNGWKKMIELYCNELITIINLICKAYIEKQLWLWLVVINCDCKEEGRFFMEIILAPAFIRAAYSNLILINGNHN